MKSQTIALDGTAASGKTTVGWLLAQRLNYLFLDTGLMYRAITWAALNTGINPHNEQAVSRLLDAITLKVLPPTVDDGRTATILIDDRDATPYLRNQDVTEHASIISAYPKVRRLLTGQQRQIARSGPVVMVGRDIGTVVLPHADLKIFTVASAETRARRRYKEYLALGRQVDYDHLLAAIVRRDELDRHNPIAPMIPAADAITINTDNLSKEQVLEKIEALIGQKSTP